MVYMAIALTTLCICNIAILCVLLFYAGRLSAIKSAPSPTDAGLELTPEEKIELDKQKKRTEAELEALQELMNYNADVAYGVRRSPTDE